MLGGGWAHCLEGLTQRWRFAEGLGRLPGQVCGRREEGRCARHSGSRDRQRGPASIGPHHPDGLGGVQAVPVYLHDHHAEEASSFPLV